MCASPSEFPGISILPVTSGESHLYVQHNILRADLSGDKIVVSPAAGLKSGQFNHQETVPFWRSFIRAPPPAKKTAGQIEKETSLEPKKFKGDNLT